MIRPVRRSIALVSVALVAIIAGCGSSSKTVVTVTVEDGRTITGESAGSTALNAVLVLRRLERAGLPIGSYVNYTAATDGNHLLGRPGQYVSKVNFQDKRIDPKDALDPTDITAGGSIETFDNEDDAQRRYDYVHAISTGSSLFAEYEYLRGTVLFRISNILTPNQAAEYERALKTIVP
jgi:hypothetical protein